MLLEANHNFCRNPYLEIFKVRGALLPTLIKLPSCPYPWRSPGAPTALPSIIAQTYLSMTVQHEHKSVFYARVFQPAWLTDQPFHKKQQHYKVVACWCVFHHFASPVLLYQPCRISRMETTEVSLCHLAHQGPSQDTRTAAPQCQPRCPSSGPAHSCQEEFYCQPT